MAQGTSKKGKEKENAVDPSEDEEYNDLYLSDTPEENIWTDPDDSKGPHHDEPKESHLEDPLEAADDQFLHSSPSVGISGKRGKKVAWVVFCGKKTGIFESWEATCAQTHGFKRSVHKGFSSMDLAISAWEHALAAGTAYPSGQHGPLDPLDSSIPSPTPVQSADLSSPSVTKRTSTKKECRRPHSEAARSGATRVHKKAPPLPSGAPVKHAPCSSTIPSAEHSSTFSSISNTYPSSSSAHINFERGRHSRAGPSSATNHASSYSVGDPWYTVIVGCRPGVYSNRSLARDALGEGEDLVVVKVATHWLAFQIFTLAFMDDEVYYT
ncbi:hypothetical protein BDN70DRAFT_938222 [Pholiota conissans]|uniref:Ribonuclease H1 N-terminal domain-containing protein n=1 Tax=Pholiota conissans TaxID=109636 RepID=A0A9P5YPN9_9AGAR|nr:hypothetical protein BDN70DRAFT_938222 [Pholiota conissans]